MQSTSRKSAGIGGFAAIGWIFLCGICNGPAQAAGTYPDSTTASSMVESALKLAAGERADSALHLLTPALELLKASGDSTSVLRALNVRGYALLRLQHLAAAESTLAAAEPIARARLSQDPVNATSTLNLISYTAIAQDRYAKALTYSSQALTLREEALGTDDPNTASSRYTHALALKWLGRYDESLNEIERSFRDLTAAYGKGHPQLVPAAMTRGIVLSELGRYDESETVLEEMLEQLRQSGLGESHDATQCMLLIGIARSHKGEFSAALDILRDGFATTRKRAGDNHVSVAAFCSSIAELFAQVGDQQSARDYAEKAKHILDPLNHQFPLGTSTILRVLSSVYLRFGDPRTALDFALRDLAAKERLLDPRHPDMVPSLENTGDVYAALGNEQNALLQYGKARAIVTPRSDPAARSTAAHLAVKEADLLRGEGRLAEAESLLTLAESSVHIAAQPLPVLEAFLFRVRGDVARDKRNFALARVHYDRAIASLCREQPNVPPQGDFQMLPAASAALQPREYLTLLLRRADALHELNARLDSVSLLRETEITLSRACDVIDDIRLVYTREASRLALAEEMAGVYDRAVETALDLADRTGNPGLYDLAVGFAERGKARSLLERMTELRTRSPEGVPLNLMDRRDALRKELLLCDMELARGEARGMSEANVSLLTSRRFTMRRDLEEIEDSLRTLSPANTALPGATATAGEIRQLLDDDTRLIEYQVGRSGLHAFVIGPAGTAATTLPLPRDFPDRVNSYAAAIRTLDRRTFAREGNLLYRLLLEPLEPHLLGVRRLVIVPDEILFTVPFEALLTRTPDARDPYSAFPYLLRTFELRYAYSASSLKELTERKTSTEESAFVGFAPVFDDSTKNQTVPPAFAEFRSVTFDGKTYRPLRYSAEEVRSLAGEFARHAQRSAMFLNEDASEESFKATAGQHRIVHVATHGVIDDEHPSLSALLFAPQERDGNGEDGVLYAGESYGLTLDADLVVLSSCESGVGRLVRGEGVLALTRGFLCAGARNVMVSLWKVYDAETQQLMKLFYDRMLQGASCAEALRAAKLAMIAEGRTAAPVKWAGFVLTGR